MFRRYTTQTHESAVLGTTSRSIGERASQRKKEPKQNAVYLHAAEKNPHPVRERLADDVQGGIDLTQPSARTRVRRLQPRPAHQGHGRTQPLCAVGPGPRRCRALNLCAVLDARTENERDPVDAGRWISVRCWNAPPVSAVLRMRCVPAGSARAVPAPITIRTVPTREFRALRAPRRSAHECRRDQRQRRHWALFDFVPTTRSLKLQRVFLGGAACHSGGRARYSTANAGSFSILVPRTIHPEYGFR